MTRFAMCSADRRDIDHHNAGWASTSQDAVVDVPSGWMDRAAKRGGDPIGRHAPLGLPCQVNDAELWFADNPADLERAKILCRGCPVRAACLTGAIARREPAGVWGGQIFQGGRVIPYKRPRGRPRKDRRIPGALPALAAGCAVR